MSIADDLRNRAAFFRNPDYVKHGFPGHLIEPLAVELESAADEIRQYRAVYEAACDQQAVLSTKPVWLEIRNLATVIALGDAIEAIATAADKHRTGSPEGSRSNRSEVPQAGEFGSGDSGEPSAVDSQWTSEPPTEPRWYWWRQGDRIEPCQITQREGGALYAWFVAERNPLAQYQWQPNWLWADMQFPAATRHGDDDG